MQVPSFPAFLLHQGGKLLGGSGSLGGSQVGDYCTSLWCLLTTAAEDNFQGKGSQHTGSPWHTTVCRMTTTGNESPLQGFPHQPWGSLCSGGIVGFH